MLQLNLEAQGHTAAFLSQYTHSQCLRYFAVILGKAETECIPAVRCQALVLAVIPAPASLALISTCNHSEVHFLDSHFLLPFKIFIDYWVSGTILGA